MEEHAGASPVSVHANDIPKTSAIGIGQFRSHLCAYVDRVSSGEALTIIRRGHPVAQMLWTDQYGPIRDSIRSVQSLGHVSGIPVELGQLRSCAGRYLDKVSDGCHLDVVQQGTRVARIVPLEPPALHTRRRC